MNDLGHSEHRNPLSFITRKQKRFLAQLGAGSWKPRGGWRASVGRISHTVLIRFSYNSIERLGNHHKSCSPHQICGREKAHLSGISRTPKPDNARLVGSECETDCFSLMCDTSGQARLYVRCPLVLVPLCIAALELYQPSFLVRGRIGLSLASID